MKPKAIIDFLWFQNREVIRHFLLDHEPLVILSKDYHQWECSQPLQEALKKSGSRVIKLSSLLTSEKKIIAQQDVNCLLHQFSDYLRDVYSTQTNLDHQQLINTIYSRLCEDIPTIVCWLQIWETVKERFDVRLMVTNEDMPVEYSIAARWASINGIKIFHLFHGLYYNFSYFTVIEANYADYLAAYGLRALEAFVDKGIAGKHTFFFTGKPEWDNYAVLRTQKSNCRSQLCGKYGLCTDIPIIVFGTTWDEWSTANNSANTFQETLKGFLLACRTLKQRGIAFNAVIKDRINNREQGAKYLNELLNSLGENPRSYHYVMDDTQLFATVADVLITVDSNYLIEGVLAGTCVINLLSSRSVAMGPCYHGDSGIVEVEAHELPEAIFQLAFNAQARARQQEKIQDVIEQHNYKNDGNAARRVAQLMHELAPDIRPWAPLPHIWQRCLSAEPVDSHVSYPAVSDYNLLNMFSNQPRIFLDIGCGTGSNARVIKEKFPDCRVWGVEPDKAAADIALSRLDKVITGRFEDIDFDKEGLVKGTLDAVLLAGTLEHMHNPWDVMVRLRSYLSAQGQVLLSVHNLRNLLLMRDISTGTFSYEEEGLLNIRHIRFFTLRELVALCNETGYRIIKSQLNPDERVWGYVEYFKGKFPASIELGKLILKEITEDELIEMCTLQFYFLLEKSA